MYTERNKQMARTFVKDDTEPNNKLVNTTRNLYNASITVHKKNLGQNIKKIDAKEAQKLME